MPTDLVWFAVALEDKLNQNLVPWKCPLKWNSKHREWNFDKDFTVRKYFFWYIIVYGLMFFWVWSAFLYLIYGKIYWNDKPEVTIMLLFQYGVLAMMNSMVAFQVAQISVLGQKNITLINAFIRYHESVKRNKNGARAKKSKKRKKPKNWLAKVVFEVAKEFGIPDWRKDDGQVDIIGICLLFCMSPIQLWIPISGGFVIVLILGIDIHKYVFVDLWPLLGYNLNSLRMILFDGLLRFVMTTAVTMEMCRTVPNLVHFLVIPAQLIIESIDILWKQSKNGAQSIGNINDGIKSLTQLHILYADSATMLGTTILLLMTFGIVLSCLLNFCCIRFLSSGLSALNYAIFVGGAGIVYFFILTLLPVAIGFHEKSRQTIINWQNNVDEKGVAISKKERGYIQRKIKAMRPTTQNAGWFGYNLYTIDKERMGIFLSSIVDNTINLLLAFDLDSIVLRF